jgi:chorismate-pyruvate lyase
MKKINQEETYTPNVDDWLTQTHIDPTGLSSFQKILLIADGTLTKILETYINEVIQVVKISEKILSIKRDIAPLEICAGTEVMKRNILLQGSTSHHNWLYAESTIVLDRIGEQFREQLINSHIPIGKLWLEHKTELFKEVITSAREPANDLSDYFNIQREDKLIYRTYRVFSKHQPIMMITEKFPESSFQDWINT